MSKKPLFFSVFVIFCIFFNISCSFQYKNCEISPDFDKISKSATENIEDLTKTDIGSANATCTY